MTTMTMFITDPKTGEATYLGDAPDAEGELFANSCKKMHAAAKKYGLDHDLCIEALNAISLGFGLKFIKPLIDFYLSRGFNDIAKIMAELLVQNHRSTYRNLGTRVIKKILKD